MMQFIQGTNHPSHGIPRLPTRDMRQKPNNHSKCITRQRVAITVFLVVVIFRFRALGLGPLLVALEVLLRVAAHLRHIYSSFQRNH